MDRDAAGSISVTAWSVVCTRTIRTLKDLAVQLVPSPVVLLVALFSRTKAPSESGLPRS